MSHVTRRHATSCIFAALTLESAPALGNAIRRQRSSKARELRLRDFGGIADGSLDGDGSDNGPALRAMLATAFAQGYKKIIIEPGTYAFDSTVNIAAETEADLTIEAWGVTIVARKPLPAPGDRFFALRSFKSRGGEVQVFGLKLSMSRPSVRTPNVDLLAIDGFRSTLLKDISILSADNMAISFDRRLRNGKIPEEIICENVVVGGRYFPSPHSHGSVGDTGIYIPIGAKWIDIQARIQSTGDDACYIGPIPLEGGTPIERGAFQLSIDAYQTTCGAHVEMSNGRISGTINTTLGAAVACNPAVDGGPGNRIDNLRIDVSINNAGVLQAGDIGQRAIPRVNACGVWLYGGGKGINLDGTTMRGVSGPGIVLQTARGQILEDVSGHVEMSGVMIDRAGATIGGNGALLKRSGTGTGAVRNISLALKADSCSCPILVWHQTGPEDDEDISVRTTLKRYSLDQSKFPEGALAIFSASGPGRVRRAKITVEQDAKDPPVKPVVKRGVNAPTAISLRLLRRTQSM